MKNALIMITLSFFAISSFASINHPTCEIYSQSTLAAPQVNLVINYDWSTRGSIDLLFDEYGYISQGTKEFSDMLDGDLFTNNITTYGGRKTRGSVEFFSYTIIIIQQKDSQDPKGYRVLAEYSSDKREDYFNSLEDSFFTSYEEAIRGIPVCRVTK